MYINTHILNLPCILLNVPFQHAKERRKNSKGILVNPEFWLVWVGRQTIYPLQSYLPWKATVTIISKQGNVVFHTLPGMAKISMD